MKCKWERTNVYEFATKNLAIVELALLKHGLAYVNRDNYIVLQSEQVDILIKDYKAKTW